MQKLSIPNNMSAYSIQRKNTFKTWLLVLFFIGLVSSLAFIFALVFENWAFLVFGIILSISQAGVALFFGDKIALASNGAREIKYQEAPQIFEIVQNLSKIADIPVPKIHISPDPSANAFACGRNPQNASICLNQGLLDLLNKSELEGVIAHELAHIKNRDILIMTVAMVLSSLVSLITDIGFRFFIFSGDRREKQSPILIILYIVAMLLTPIISLLLQMAISRSREYLADATAVVLTRYPQGLASALQKLYNNPVPTNHYSTSMNHFYIAPPKKKFGEKINQLFSTHPAIADRIQALQNIS